MDSGVVSIGDTGQRDQHPTGSAKCESSYVAEWAPNGRSVAVGCDGAVAIVDDPSGRSRLVALPDGMMPYAIRWTDDGQRLLIGSVDGGHPRFDLQILSIAISSDEISVVDRVDPTSFELTDTLAFRPTFSPDGHSLMVVGSRAEADYDHAVIYVVRTRGGLPREVLDGYQVSGSRGFWWSRDGTSMAYVRGSGPTSGERLPAELVREDLRARRLTTVAVLPDSYLTGVFELP